MGRYYTTTRGRCQWASKDKPVSADSALCIHVEDKGGTTPRNCLKRLAELFEQRGDLEAVLALLGPSWEIADHEVLDG